MAKMSEAERKHQKILDEQLKDVYDDLYGGFNIHMYGWCESDAFKIFGLMRVADRLLSEGANRPEEPKED